MQRRLFCGLIANPHFLLANQRQLAIIETEFKRKGRFILMTYPKNKIVSLDRIFKFTDIETAIDSACKDITDQGYTVISTSINDHGKDAICLITYL